MISFDAMARHTIVFVRASIRQLIVERRDGPTIRNAGLARGMKAMLHDGLAKVFLGSRKCSGSPSDRISQTVAAVARERASSRG